MSAPAMDPVASFVIRGFVDDLPTCARYENGRLDADKELLRRANIVVALGDEFVLPDSPSRAIPASLVGGGIDVMLTLVRAFSRVTAIELELEPSEAREHAL